MRDMRVGGALIILFALGQVNPMEETAGSLLNLGADEPEILEPSVPRKHARLGDPFDGLAKAGSFGGEEEDDDLDFDISGDEEGSESKQDSKEVKKPAGPPPDPEEGEAPPKLTHPYGPGSWDRLADSLLDCPAAKAKDYAYTQKDPAKRMTAEEVDKEPLVNLFKSYALEQKDVVEGQCEGRLPRKELLVVIDSGTKELFGNDFDKAYTPTPAPKALLEHVELLGEEEEEGRRKLRVTTSPRESEDAPYRDWGARIREKEAHYPLNKPTPGPTYANTPKTRGDATPYAIENLKLASHWAEFNSSDPQPRTTYPDGSPIYSANVKPYPTDVITGFGAPTISSRDEICMLEGVVKFTGSGSNVKSTIATLTQNDCFPTQDLVFVLAGSRDMNQVGCKKDSRMQDLGDSAEVTDLGNGGYWLTVQANGEIVAQSEGGVNQWCYITLSGVMWPKKQAKREALALDSAFGGTKLSRSGTQLSPHVIYPHVKGPSGLSGYGYCFVDGVVQVSAQGEARKRPFGLLPGGCRPTEPQYFTLQGFTGSNGRTSIVTVQVTETGEMIPFELHDSVQWFSLSGVTFPLGQPPAIHEQNLHQHGRHTGTDVTVDANGAAVHTGVTRRYLDVSLNWDNVDYAEFEAKQKRYANDPNGYKHHDFGNATFSVDHDGYCRVQGMLELRAGRSPNGIIGNFTEDCLPATPVVFNLRTNTGMALVKVDVNGDIMWLSSSATPDAVASGSDRVTLSLDPIAFNSFNHMRETKGLVRKCVSGRWENKDHPCWKTTWRDVMHSWPGKMLRAVFHDMCWVGSDPVMNVTSEEVLEKDAWVDYSRVEVICRTLKTCITSVHFWTGAKDWEKQCLDKSEAWVASQPPMDPRALEQGKDAATLNAGLTKCALDHSLVLPGILDHLMELILQLSGGPRSSIGHFQIPVLSWTCSW
jgi:hypothetical protein